jgi:hypothetical protein
MNIIAAECTVKKHHPEWSNVRNAPPSFAKSHLTVCEGVQHNVHQMDDSLSKWSVGEGCPYGEVL